MTVQSFVKLSCALALVASFLVYAESSCGQTMRDVYRMDFLGRFRHHEGKVMYSYFIDLAFKDYEEIRNSGGTKHHFYADPEGQLLKLEEAIGEYIEVLKGPPNRTSESLDKQTSDALFKRLDELRSSQEYAERAFRALGVERCIAYARERTRSSMESLKGAEKISRVNSALGSEGLHDLLGLDEDQRERCKDVIAAQQKVVAAKVDEVLQRISRLSNQRWEDLLRCLPDEHRDDIRLRFGDPVEWFRYQVRSSWFLGVVNPKTGRCGGGAVFQGTKLTEKMSGKPFSEISHAELVDMGGLPISPICIGLFAERSVWHELDATDEQIDLNKLFSNRARKFGFCWAEKDNSRFLSMLDGSKPEYECFETMLPHQKERLAEMEIQIRCGKRTLATVGLTHPVVVEHFGFSKDVVSELVEIGETYSKKERELLSVVEKIRAEGHAELREFLAEVLTVEQHERYFDLMGEKLAADLSIP